MKHLTSSYCRAVCRGREAGKDKSRKVGVAPVWLLAQRLRTCLQGGNGARENSGRKSCRSQHMSTATNKGHPL